LILETHSDLAPGLLLVVAAVTGVAGLLWMRDSSREPLATSCIVPVHHAVRVTGHTLEQRGRKTPDKSRPVYFAERRRSHVHSIDHHD
jgi:hypothetical protein